MQEGASNDYTKTTSAVTIVGTAPADGDLLKIDIYESITIWDTVPATGGTFSGNVSFSGTTTTTGDATHNGNIIMATNKKIQQKGAFMQSSTHQAMVLGG